MGTDRVYDAIFDPETKTWITFDNASDALLAKLSLEHKFSNETIDIVLNILNNPAFDSKSITLKKAIDIDCRIANQKQHQIIPNFAGCQTAGMPHDILYSVMETVRHSMIPLFAHVERFEESGFGAARVEPAYQTLCQMCLVHRSWTGIARKGLSHRVFLRLSSFPHRSFFRNSSISSHSLCELAVSFDPPQSSRKSAWHLFVDIIVHSPNLRELSIELLDDVDFDDLSLLTEALVGLNGLEKLRFNCMLLSTALSDFCKELPRLVCLKSLTLIDDSPEDFGIYIRDSPDSSLPHHLANSRPPDSLKSLSILCPGLPYCHWLLRPRHGYAVRDLVIRPGWQNAHTVTPIAFRESLPFLASLQLWTSRDKNFVRNHREDLKTKALNLLFFSLVIEDEGDWDCWKGERLPSTVVDFHVHFTDIPLWHSLSEDDDTFQSSFTTLQYRAGSKG